jgi:hypothetical protein
MLSREVVERQQRLAVLRQATYRPVVLDGVDLDKGVEAALASFFVSAIQMSCSAAAPDFWTAG